MNKLFTGNFLTIGLLLLSSFVHAQEFNFNCVTVDADFQEYFDAFMTNATALNHDFSNQSGTLVFSDDLPSNIAGQSRGSCREGFDIEINRSIWNRYTQNYLDAGNTVAARLWQKRLIYHELGHALLERGHICNQTGSAGSTLIIRDEIMTSGGSCGNVPVIASYNILANDVNFNSAAVRLFLNIDQTQLHYSNCGYTGKGPSAITCEIQ